MRPQAGRVRGVDRESTLAIAVSKGRILSEFRILLDRLGIKPAEDPETSRSLVIPLKDRGLRLVIVRAADVPTYVDYGAADLGVAGKDVLLEYRGEGFYEPLDLDIARCKLVVAGKAEPLARAGRLRVATKYVQTTRRHFAQKGDQVEVIHLYGSMELAPLLGLADCIVDLIDTGNTLKANGLVVLETIAEISARLIINKAAMKVKNTAVKALIVELAEAVDKAATDRKLAL
ncbi:MAG: ATP phosphoribosyltransferase [Gammaproteobacteria bacterium]